MATAATLGGAAGIRANTPVDIAAIRAALPQTPLIGLWKVVIPGFEDVYITPRIQDAVAVADSGADMIAIDATLRPHPEGTTAALIRAIKHQTDKLVLADVDNVAAAVAAVDAGADAVSTTLSGYTPHSPTMEAPDLELVAALAGLDLGVPVFAEGRIATPDQARAALDCGAWAVVVGGAITRPVSITQRFAQKVAYGKP
jgi:N-acylglucosamine-6-phosphate 2-epimerase